VERPSAQSRDAPDSLAQDINTLGAGGPVDVIITGWNMPDMSGIDFIRSVRSMPDTNDTPMLHAT
jgi:CheY-like chemotaxis protein